MGCASAGGSADDYVGGRFASVFGVWKEFSAWDWAADRAGAVFRICVRAVFADAGAVPAAMGDAAGRCGYPEVVRRMPTCEWGGCAGAGVLFRGYGEAD